MNLANSASRHVSRSNNFPALSFSGGSDDPPPTPQFDHKERKKRKPEEEKKVAKTRVVWRKKKKLVSAIRQKSNATRRVVNTPGPPLFNFNELAKIQDGPLSSTPPRFDVIMSRREGGATVCTIASMIRGADTRKRILNVMPGYTGIRFQLHSSWHEHVSRYTISLIYREVT